MAITAGPRCGPVAITPLPSGEALLSPSVTRSLIGEFARISRPARAAPSALASLTDREKEVLLLMAQGLSNAEIATRLFLSAATVKTHVGRILDKLSLRDRIQAVVFAYENNLVEPSSGGGGGR
ncbi:MAG: response regulator transcription factor [Candidatus Dormibacterales bacterium]